MRGFEAAKILIIKNFKESAVRVPGPAAADKFAVGSGKRVEDCVIEFLIISNKVELIRVYYLKRRTSNCFWVVPENFN